MFSQDLTDFFSMESQARDDVKILLKDQLPLDALFITLNSINLLCALRGEDNTILTFDAQPLSYSLRLVGGGAKSTVRMMKDRENASEKGTLHSEDDLHRLCASILDYLQEKKLEDFSGSLRPVPKPDSQLLSLLRTGDQETKVHRFAEGFRMISRGHLLDAVVELFTPFGLQPDLDIEESTVRFKVPYLKTNGQYAGLRICRFRKNGAPILAPSRVPDFDAEDNMALDLESCVTVQFVRAYSTKQKQADKQRRVELMLKKAGYVDETDEKELGQKIMMYDLSKRDDVLALVERVLLMRDIEKKSKYPFEVSKWMGKQDTPVKKLTDGPSPTRMPHAHAYWLRKSGDRETEVNFDRTRKREVGDMGLREFAAANWKEERDAELLAKTPMQTRSKAKGNRLKLT